MKNRKIVLSFSAHTAAAGGFVAASALTVLLICCGIACAPHSAVVPAELTAAPPAPAPPKSELPLVDVKPALDFMNLQMDLYHQDIAVYTDDSDAGNHFVALARMTVPGTPEKVAQNALPPMVTNYPDPELPAEPVIVPPHSGDNCIQAKVRFKKDGSGPDWGGWYFQNGVLTKHDLLPTPNWGTVANAGFDLSGVTKLTFWARGLRGGEKIEFFCGGVGYENGIPLGQDDQGHGIVAHDGLYKHNEVTTDDDPNPKAPVTLTAEWKKYTIDLSGANLSPRENLSSVLGGFAWVAANRGQPRDGRNADEPDNEVTFFLDDIKFELSDDAKKKRLGLPRFIVSYQTRGAKEDFDKVLKNVAFAYDNSLALLAYLAAGDTRRAGLIADALVEAEMHDRRGPKRYIRTAFQAGDLILAPGWEPLGQKGCYRTTGWMDHVKGKSEREWKEDNYFLGLNTGNMAWVCLALLSYHETALKQNLPNSAKYLTAAREIAGYIRDNYKIKEGIGGYRAGNETDPDDVDAKKKKTFVPGDEHNKKLTYRATEHAIDYYAVCVRLAHLVVDPKEKDSWKREAGDSLRFVKAMWDEGTKPPNSKDAPFQSTPFKFWTGTVPNGDEPNRDVVPVDIQVWSHLALRGAGEKFKQSMDYAEKFHRNGQGYDFKQTDSNGGVWPEGTAQMAAGYIALENVDKAKDILNFLHEHVDSGMVAALPNDPSKETLYTGFKLSDNKTDWNYYKRKHLGATAWYILAAYGKNPYYLNSAAPELPDAPAEKPK